MEPAPQPAPTGLAVLGQVAVTVSDVDRAIAFYRDTLGMKLLYQFPGLGFFDCAGVRLMLSKSERPAETYSSILYFKVPDIHAAFHDLGGRGVRFEDDPHLIARMPDHELWMAFFRDSENNLLALMSELRQ